ncbi:hypothetical protein [Pseudobdellovibrio exovorus]|uniref:hypothetical protein n=1 Tax=Pseudobdellovibrio exovorus TaxID=453816 RepID=UPI0005A06784|nr:hypothetical protein [Pseudobdellovibrio exovorus]
MGRNHLFLISAILFFSLVSHSEIRTSMVVQGLSFISPDYESASSKSFAFLGANLKTNPKSDDLFRINLTGMYAMGNSVLSFLNIRETYFSTSFEDKSELHIGRKLHNWSSLDSVWNLGVYQPQFRWNPLAPENQGLTGLFWEKRNQGFAVSLFASPLYIPDQGASFELKDGQFQASNPWFPMPPQNVRFQGQLLPIDYNVDKPEVSEVIFQTQYGAQVRMGEGRGFFANLAGMYKPSNQLALGYKGVLVTTRVRIDVTPKVYYENVYSADFGYRDTWGAAQLSVLYSQPKDPKFDDGFNSPQFDESLSWGPQIFFRYQPFTFFLAYLDTTGGKVKDVGPDADDNRASLSNRFQFRQAALARATYTGVFWNQFRLDSTLQYKFSPSESFRQINFKNAVKLRGPWAFWVDVLLIDTDSEKNSAMEAYKSLDQVWAGVSYDI